jgi:hypothetical protein
MNKIFKNQKGFTAVEGLLIVLTLVVIGAVGYMVYHNDHKTNNSSINYQSAANNKNNVNQTTDPNTAAIINDIQQSLSAKLSVESTNSNPPNANTLYINVSQQGGPANSVSGYNFYIDPSKGTTLYVNYYQQNSGGNPTPSIVNTYQNTVANEFSKLKLDLIKSPAQSEAAATYQNNTAVCSFTAGTNGGYPSSVSCVDKSAYPPLAAIISPLAKAYYSANPLTAGSVEATFDTPIIKTSETPGYKFATMGLGESQSWYYQKDGAWYFYAAGQAGFFCNFTTNTEASLNNNDARLAFLGQPCQNSDGSESTVQ